MSTFQIWKKAFIEDVNNENSKTIYLFGNVTNCLFDLIKWAGIPYVLYLFWKFLSL
jgi:hypothetical protein